MLVDDQPLPVDLAVYIGDANSEIQGLAIFVWPVGSEDAVPIREVPLSFRLPVADLSVNSTRVRRQKAFPILSERCGTDVLARREGIKNEQILIRRVVRHDAVDILGIDSSNKMLHRCVDIGLVVRLGTRGGDTGGDHRQRCEERATPVHLTISFSLGSAGIPVLAVRIGTYLHQCHHVPQDPSRRTAFSLSSSCLSASAGYSCRLASAEA